MRCGYEILTKVGTIPILSNSNNQIQIDTKNNTLDEGWRCYDWATRLENLYIRLFRVPLLVVFFFVVFLAEPLSVYLNSILSEEDVDKVVEREMDGIPHDTPSTPWETDSFRARVCTCDNPLACAIPRFRLRHPSEEDVSSSSRSIELGARKKLFEGRKQNGCRLVNDTSLGSLNIGSRLIDVERIVFEELVGGRAWSWVE